ncbi:hypothetical protein D3C80_1860140 [compost metagenome]
MGAAIRPESRNVAGVGIDLASLNGVDCTLQFVFVPNVILVGKGNKIEGAEVDITNQSKEVTRGPAESTGVR